MSRPWKFWDHFLRAAVRAAAFVALMALSWLVANS